ncbi:MAG: hypothetical protein ABIF45_17535 [Pseudomonadota bacterium]
MSATVTDTERAIFDLLCDQDDELDVNEALSTLAMVAAAVCCLCDDREQPAEAFANAFAANVAAYVPDEARMLS